MGAPQAIVPRGTAAQTRPHVLWERVESVPLAGVWGPRGQLVENGAPGRPSEHGLAADAELESDIPGQRTPDFVMGCMHIHTAGWCGSRLHPRTSTVGVPTAEGEAGGAPTEEEAGATGFEVGRDADGNAERLKARESRVPGASRGTTALRDSWVQPTETHPRRLPPDLAETTGVHSGSHKCVCCIGNRES